MRAILMAVVLAAGAVAAGAGGDGKADVSKKLIGTWQLTKGVVGGSPFPHAVAKKLRLELTEGKYRLTGAESPDEGTWEVHRGKKPLAMDVHGTEGPNKGKTYLTIFKLAGDRLTVCYDLSGKARPARFESLPKTLLFLAEYTRVKS